MRIGLIFAFLAILLVMGACLVALGIMFVVTDDEGGFTTFELKDSMRTFWPENYARHVNNSSELPNATITYYVREGVVEFFLFFPFCQAPLAPFLLSRPFLRQEAEPCRSFLA
jgi:hypothetical protein